MLFSAPIIETVAGFLEEHPVPLVVDPVMVAASGAQLLQDDAVAVLVERLFPLATVVTPNLHEACALAGAAYRRTPIAEALAEAIHALGAPAVVVTGGHGAEAVDWLFDGERHVPIPVERHGDGRDARRRLHALGEPRRLPRPRARPSRTPPAAPRASPAEAVRNGLAEIGAGSGPVDVFGLAAVRAR